MMPIHSIVRLPQVSMVTLLLISPLILQLQLHVDASSLAATTDMVWSDEFTTFQNKNWNVATKDAPIPATGIQSFTSDNVAISDSDYLTITAQSSLTSSSTYTSGQIDTFGKVQFQYCTISARIKIPNTTLGLVPTFYTQGVEKTSTTYKSDSLWPSNGEIDILKVGQGNATSMGNGNERVVSGIHYINDKDQFISDTGSRDCNTDLSSNYYIYTLDWSPTTITTFYNDRQIWSTDISNCWNDQECLEFHQPHFMIFHMSVGGSFPSNQCEQPNAASASGGAIPNVCTENQQVSAQEVTATLPASMYIDWVRIYNNGDCQLTILENDGGTILPDVTPEQAPVTTDTGESVPMPVGSDTGGAGSPAGSNSGMSPGVSPTTSNTAPGGGVAPTTSDSGNKYTFPPDLSPIGSDSGESPGLSPTSTDSGSSGGTAPAGSDSGSSGGTAPAGSDSGSSGGAPAGSDSGSSGGLSPTSSVTSPVEVAAPTTKPVTAPVPVVRVPLPPQPVLRPVSAEPVLPPASKEPTTNVVQPPTASVDTGSSKGKKKCKDGKKISPPGVVTGDNVNGKGSGKGGGKGESNSNGESGVTGDSTGNSTNIFTPRAPSSPPLSPPLSSPTSPSTKPTTSSNSETDSETEQGTVGSGYRYHQRRNQQKYTIASKQSMNYHRRNQISTANGVGPDSVGTTNSTDSNVESGTGSPSSNEGPASKEGPAGVVGPGGEEDCEETDSEADSLAVESGSSSIYTHAAIYTAVLSVAVNYYNLM